MSKGEGMLWTQIKNCTHLSHANDDDDDDDDDDDIYYDDKEEGFLINTNSWQTGIITIAAIAQSVHFTPQMFFSSHNLYTYIFHCEKRLDQAV